MRYKLLITLITFIPLLALAQENNSKADNLFYSYNYESAIAEYTKERAKGELTSAQKLNFADAYFKTGKYNEASELYLDVNKNDTIMTINRFNNMLQSLSKNSEQERVKTFMRSKANLLSNELIENAEFNYTLLENAGPVQNLTIVNMQTNSPQGDFSTAFYKDGLLFSSSRIQKSKKVYEPSGESYLDIYLAKLDNSGKIISSEPFGKIPDSKFHQATPYFDEKLGMFFYILSNTQNGELAFDDNGKNALSIGTLSDNGTFRFLLKDLSTSFYYPFFDTGSDRLFFAANFDDSYGGTDLYYVYTNNGQIMSAPINLGPRINSPGNEISPYIFDGSLYFSSDVFYGIGGMDVYKSKMELDNTFSIPVNLGNGINTKSDDFAFVIKKDSVLNQLTGYLSSNRPGGKGGDDIYQFRIDQELGLKTFALRGTVVNLKNKAGLANTQIKLLNKEGELIKEVITNDNGVYRVEIPWQPQVTVKGSKAGYSIFTMTYSQEGMEDLQKSTFDIGLIQLKDLLVEAEGKEIIKLDKFYFDRGRSTVNAQVTEQLDKVVEAVARFPQLRLSIETHTDSRGSSASNRKLSQQRSDAIKEYLEQQGVPSSAIIESIGFGEERLKNKCVDGAYCLDFLHKQNERSLIVVQY